MIRLYLDDLRDIPKSLGFTGARTFEEATELLIKHDVEILSLDHDLGEDVHGKELLNGYDLVKWICENYEGANLRIKAIYIHSDNPVGREAMYQTLLAAKRRGFIDTEYIYYYPYTKNVYSGNGSY